MSFLDIFVHPTLDALPERQRKLPLILAVLIHISVFIASLIPATFFSLKPDIEEVITVDLVEMAAQAPAPSKPVPPPPIKKEPPPPEPKPEPVPEVTSIATPEALPVPAPAEIISLNPRKMKKKIEPDKKVVLEKKRVEALERIQAKVNQKQEEQKKKHALAKLREALHTVKPAPEAQPSSAQTSNTDQESQQATGESAPSSGSTELMDRALKQYYVAVSRRIHEHWILPEMQKWDESLEALFVIVVRRDGIIINSFFEKKSQNMYFNDFVEKTIQAASPLPPFPSDLKEAQKEIGLRFHPSGLF